ncbi:MAG TPA: hypothetical protein VNP37_16050, partial [Actinomycetospora sp.]|nr:hypothetical protein [Actinomycetospora sp.]
VPAVAPVAAASPVPAPVSPRPAAPAAPRPAPSAPAPEETTDAFTVRAAPTPPRRPTGDQPALSVLAGLDSPLSFGPTRGRTVPAGSGYGTRRPRPTPPRGQPHVGVPTPPPLPEPTRDPSGPLPAAAGTRPVAHRVGAHAAAPEGAVPAPRARHRADVEDPVAARRGGGDGGGDGGGRRARGRHASTEAPSAAARGGR